MCKHPMMLFLVATIGTGCGEAMVPVSDPEDPIVADDPVAPTVEESLASADAIVSDAFDFAELDALLADNVGLMGGGGGLILFRDGQVIFRKTYGVDPFSDDPFTPRTVVPLASASKWWSGMTVAAVAEDTDLGLDDRAGDWLPGYSGAKADMTPRQLFSHSAGLNDQPTYHRFHNLADLQTAVDLIHYGCPGCATPMAAVADEYTPGTALWYAGVGMQVAGRMSEVATGMSWSELFAHYITGPLGLTDTDFFGYTGPNYGVATDNPDVGGTVRTSLNSYAKLVWTLMSGGRYAGIQILPAEAVTELERCTTCDVPQDQVFRTPFEPYYGYDDTLPHYRTAIGSWTERDPVSGEVVGLISGGAWGCMPFIDFERGLGGVFLPFSTVREYDPEISDEPYNPVSVLFMDQIRPAIRAAIDGT